MDFFPGGTETLGAEPARFRPEVEIDGQLSRADRCRRSDPTLRNPTGYSRLASLVRSIAHWRSLMVSADEDWAEKRTAMNGTYTRRSEPS